MGKQTTDLRLSSYRRKAGSLNQRRRYQRRPVAASSARRSIMEGRAGNCIARPQPNGNRHQCDEGEGISRQQQPGTTGALEQPSQPGATSDPAICRTRSEEHTSELQSLMRISYAVFCLKKKKQLIIP